MSEKKVIKKSDWVSNFTLIGTPVVNDYTFKINERSEKSKWVYNSMNLGVDCGDAFGTVWAECMGGYSEENENRIYAHGKTETGGDDYEKQIIVSWEDRNNEDILEEIGGSSFFVCGLEKTDKDKVYYKNFLSPYDAIAYTKEHLSDDMVVVVKGSLKYSEYNGNVQVRKNITYIGLAIDNKTKDFVTPDKFKATFTQSILIDKDSASLKADNIDKDKGVMFVDARVLDYLKEKDGIEVKGQYPYRKRFEFPMNFENEKQCKTIYEKMFKVKKGINQVTFEGNFVEGGSVVAATWDDIPDDIKDLVEMGVYSKEEALTKCTTNGGRERRMVLRKPQIRLVGDDKVPVVSIYPERYTEEDLVLDYLYNNDLDDDKPPFDAEETDADDSMSWLNAL
jgi:hypothetical protein